MNTKLFFSEMPLLHATACGTTEESASTLQAQPEELTIPRRITTARLFHYAALRQGVRARSMRAALAPSPAAAGFALAFSRRLEKSKGGVFMFVLCVAGGRAFSDRALLVRSLDRVLRERGPLVLWHGGCPSGADALAADWAAARGVPCRVWAADWARFGRAAGPLRSRAMLAAAAATGSCGLVAFPGGRGTAAACAAARALGVGVWVRC